MKENKLIPAGGYQERQEFYGNFILSTPGRSLIALTVLLIWIGISFYRKKPDPWLPLEFLPLMLAFLFVLGGQLCYFNMNDDTLEIRNHIFRWYRKKYRLKDIEILIFERSMSIFSFSLRVKSVNSRPWSYFAGSLRYEDWYDFEKALKKKGIPVDNKLW